MNGMTLKKKEFQLPRLESVERITHLPIVESGWKYAENVYKRIKNSNNLFQWTLDQAENSIYGIIDTASPAVFLIEGPLTAFDKVICRSLDLVEQRVPSINLPPQMIYYNTKQYMTDVSGIIVKPVLKRTNSVKQIGTAVLSSKYTAFAADKLDGALNVADKYVDKYLPDASDGQAHDEYSNKFVDGPAQKALQTIQHMDRFSRKLQRGLTRRTLAEARALKEQSAEAIHVLVYVAELIYTDPKLAFQKGKELWESLSKDEPENQARPDNLEQLIVLLTRESARRMVHFINFTSAGVSKLPRQATRYIRVATNKCLQIVNSLLKTVHLDGVRQAIVDRAKIRAYSFTELLKQLNSFATDILVIRQFSVQSLRSESRSSIDSGFVDRSSRRKKAKRRQKRKTDEADPKSISKENVADILAQQIKEPVAQQQVQKQPIKTTPIIPQTTITKPTNKTYEIRQQFETLQPPASPKAQYKATHRQVANGVEN